MTDRNQQEDTSTIGSGYLHPISSLLEKLNSLEPTDFNEVKVSTIEFSYSAAVIILAALLVESITNGAQVFGQTSQGKKPLHPVNYVCETYLKPPFSASASEEVLKEVSDLKQVLKEVFVVRDAIAHNHLWTTQFYHDCDDQAKMKLVFAQLEVGFGDRKFKDVIDPITNKTRKLGINLIPTKLCRKDVKILLKSVISFLGFLEQFDSKFIGISERPVQHHGQTILFTDLVENIKTYH